MKSTLTVRVVGSRMISFTDRSLQVDIHHQPALLWRFRDSGAGYKTAYLLSYLEVEPFFTFGAGSLANSKTSVARPRPELHDQDQDQDHILLV